MKIKRKLKSQAGLSLAETLLAVLILIFVGMMVLLYSWIFLVVCNLQIIPPIHPR